MKKPSKKLLIWLCVLVSPIVAWNIAYPTNTIRYKVTVNIETPEGLKSGSAVREVKIQQTPRILPEVNAHVEQKGEAVAVDLGERGVAFAVMGTDDYWTFFMAFPPPEGAGVYAGEGTQKKGARYYDGLKDQKTVLPLGLQPLIVAFKDIKDPKTVEPVYRVIATPIPSSRDYTYTVEDNFEKIFGTGVHLKDITIETTDEKVMWGIEKYLSWLEVVNGGYLDGKFAGGGPELSNILQGGHFQTGRLK